jgi:hypothetical protein
VVLAVSGRDSASGTQTQKQPASAPKTNESSDASEPERLPAIHVGVDQPKTEKPKTEKPKTEKPKTEKPKTENSPGRIKINLLPYALVRVNGQPRGQTPLELSLPAGSYKLELSNPDTGHQIRRTVDVQSGKVVSIKRW